MKPVFMKLGQRHVVLTPGFPKAASSAVRALWNPTAANLLELKTNRESSHNDSKKIFKKLSFKYRYLFPLVKCGPLPAGRGITWVGPQPRPAQSAPAFRRSCSKFTGTWSLRSTDKEHLLHPSTIYRSENWVGLDVLLGKLVGCFCCHYFHKI